MKLTIVWLFISTRLLGTPLTSTGKACQKCEQSSTRLPHRFKFSLQTSILNWSAAMEHLALSRSGSRSHGAASGLASSLRTGNVSATPKRPSLKNETKRTIVWPATGHRLKLKRKGKFKFILSNWKFSNWPLKRFRLSPGFRRTDKRGKRPKFVSSSSSSSR